MINDEIVSQLDELDPLSLPHWSWPDASGRFWAPENRKLAQAFARVAGHVSLHWAQRIYCADARAVINAVSGTKLCIAGSIWRAAPKDAQSHLIGLARLDQSFRTIKTRVGEASFILLNHEYSKLEPDSGDSRAAFHNAVIAERLTAAERIVRESHPDAKIAYYPAPSRHGQGLVGPPLEYAVRGLYYPDDWGETMRRFGELRGLTLANYREYADILPIMPSISLGCGYSESSRFSLNLDYPVSHSHRLGEFFASKPRGLGAVFMWPDPMRSSNFWPHFIELVRGQQ